MEKHTFWNWHFWFFFFSRQNALRSKIKTNVAISRKNQSFESDIFIRQNVLNQNNHCHFTEKINFFNLTFLFVKMLYVLKSKLTLQFHEKKNTFNSFLNFSCELKSARNARNPSSEPVTPWTTKTIVKNIIEPNAITVPNVTNRSPVTWSALPTQLSTQSVSLALDATKI